MPSPSDIFDDNLIDIAQYNPHLRLYLEESKDIIERELGDIRMMLYEWEGDMITHRAVDLIELALLECEDNIVYRVMDRLGYENKELNEYVCFKAGKYGRLEVIGHMIENTEPNWHHIAMCFALTGDRDIVMDIIKSGVRNFATACFAAQSGNKELVDELVKLLKGPNPLTARALTNIAKNAALEGHRDILNYYINKGANEYNIIVKYAARGGYLDIVKNLIRLGATDYTTIACEAAKNGHEEIVDYITSNYDSSPQAIAANAAMGGYKEIVIDSIRNVTASRKTLAILAAGYNHMDIFNEMIGDRILTDRNWVRIAKMAAENGYKEIVKDIIDKDIDVGELDFKIHEDARLYFK